MQGHCKFDMRGPPPKENCYYHNRFQGFQIKKRSGNLYNTLRARPYDILVNIRGEFFFRQTVTTITDSTVP